MKVFTHKNQMLWNGFHLVGVLLILIGLIIWIISYFIGNETDEFKLFLIVGVSFLLGLLGISTYSGAQLDFDQNKFRSYQSIFWIKFGKWEDLPEIDQAELLIHSFRRRNTPNGISPTLSLEVTVYKCVLLSNGAKFLALNYEKEKDAIAALGKIKNGLGLEKEGSS